MGRILPFCRSKRGQALIEFAFILPFLLIITGGIVDFGLAFFVGQVIENAAREGARAGSVLQSPTGQVSNCTFPCSDPPILKVASDKIPNVALFGGFTLESKFFDSPPSPKNQASFQVTVTGSYNWFLLQLIGFEPITISRTAEMRWEWQTQA